MGLRSCRILTRRRTPATFVDDHQQQSHRDVAVDCDSMQLIFPDIYQSSRFMVFVAAPETATRVSFPKPGMYFKHHFRTIRLQHALCFFYRIFLWDVHWEVNMTSSESKITKFKSKPFEISKCLGASIDMRLLLKTVVITFGFKHHGHPIVPCVMRWLFKASAIFYFHSNKFLLSHLYRAGESLPRATKRRYSLTGEKRDATFHPRVLRCCFRPCGIPSRS